MALMHFDYGSWEAQPGVEDTEGEEEKERSEYSSRIALIMRSPLTSIIYFLDILMEGRIKKIMRKHQDMKNVKNNIAK